MFHGLQFKYTDFKYTSHFLRHVSTHVETEDILCFNLTVKRKIIFSGSWGNSKICLFKVIGSLCTPLFWRPVIQSRSRMEVVLVRINSIYFFFIMISKIGHYACCWLFLICSYFSQTPSRPRWHMCGESETWLSNLW